MGVDHVEGAVVEAEVEDVAHLEGRRRRRRPRRRRPGPRSSTALGGVDADHRCPGPPGAARSTVMVPGPQPTSSRVSPGTQVGQQIGGRVRRPCATGGSAGRCRGGRGCRGRRSSSQHAPRSAIGKVEIRRYGYKLSEWPHRSGSAPSSPSTGPGRSAPAPSGGACPSRRPASSWPRSSARSARPCSPGPPSGVEPTRRGRELHAQVADSLDRLEHVLVGLDGGPVPGAPTPVLRLGSSAEYFSAVVVPRLRPDGPARRGPVRVGPRDPRPAGARRAGPGRDQHHPGPTVDGGRTPLGMKRFVLVGVPGSVPRRPAAPLEAARRVAGRAALGGLQRRAADDPTVLAVGPRPTVRRRPPAGGPGPPGGGGRRRARPRLQPAARLRLRRGPRPGHHGRAPPGGRRGLRPSPGSPAPGRADLDRGLLRRFVVDLAGPPLRG